MHINNEPIKALLLERGRIPPHDIIALALCDRKIDAAITKAQKDYHAYLMSADSSYAADVARAEFERKRDDSEAYWYNLASNSVMPRITPNVSGETS
jgi:hypothetical protein